MDIAIIVDIAIAVAITAIATIANNVYIFSCDVGYFGLFTFGFITALEKQRNGQIFTIHQTLEKKYSNNILLTVHYINSQCGDFLWFGRHNTETLIQSEVDFSICRRLTVVPYIITTQPPPSTTLSCVLQILQPPNKC